MSTAWRKTATAWLPKAPQFDGDLTMVLPACGGDLQHIYFCLSSLQEKLYHSLEFCTEENKNQAEDAAANAFSSGEI